jgi:hypothetical protein
MDKISSKRKLNLFLFGRFKNYYYISVMEKFKITLNVVIVTSVIGLALSYVTQLLNIIPDISFLEAVGIYCLWTPIHHYFNSLSQKDNI